MKRTTPYHDTRQSGQVSRVTQRGGRERERDFDARRGRERCDLGESLVIGSVPDVRKNTSTSTGRGNRIENRSINRPMMNYPFCSRICPTYRAWNNRPVMLTVHRAHFTRSFPLSAKLGELSELGKTLSRRHVLKQQELSSLAICHQTATPRAIKHIQSVP